MTKEYNWSTTVDGVPHAILCQVMNNKYVLWADDKFQKLSTVRTFRLLVEVWMKPLNCGERPATLWFGLAKKWSFL